MAKEEHTGSAVSGPPIAFKFLGGRICLDFNNTVDWQDDWRDGGLIAERLRSFADLAAWGAAAGILTAGEADALLQAAAQRPAEADAALNKAIRLRRAVHTVFSAAARGERVDAAELDELNTWVSEAFASAQLVPKADGFAWGWKTSPSALELPLWAVAKSAAELLTSAGLSRVGECMSHGCGWLFFDTSRNGSRQWCEMKVCGNRAKARRHYEKTKFRV